MTDKEIMNHRFCKKNIKKSTGVLAESIGISRKEYEDACKRAMEAKLVYGKYTENLAEIGMVKDYPKLLETDSITWKQMFVEWANELEDKYPDIDEVHADYLLMISSFAKEGIFDYASIEQFPWYFTFGSWEKYPYQSTYLVVYATDVRDAVKKYRAVHPDINENTVNCAAWYNAKEWEEIQSSGTGYKEAPAEVIW